MVQERRQDPRQGMSLLVEDWVSRASALQRKGRAGRVRAGLCWGLYTRHRFENRMRRFQVRVMAMLLFDCNAARVKVEYCIAIVCAE